MSDRISFGVEYEAHYDPANLQVVFRAVCSAVVENWTEHHNELSPSEPLSPVDFERWLREANPERMHRVLRRWQSLYSVPLHFSYSPTSAWVAELVASRWDDGTLHAWIWISYNSLIETLSDLIERREEDPDFRAPWPSESDPDYLAWWERFHATHREPWQVNRDCLLHIFDCLRGVLSVRKASLDERLLKGLDPRTSEYARLVRLSPPTP